MNVNFGLFPPLAHSTSRSADGVRLRGTAKVMAKRRALTARALADLDVFRGTAACDDTAVAASATSLVPSSETKTMRLPEPHHR
jgi:hypothetical protein